MESIIDPKSHFDAYIEAFNRGDFEKLGEYYCDDVHLVNGGGRVLAGRDEIFDFYRKVRSMAARTIRVIKVIDDERSIAAELESEFEAIVDAPDFPSGPMLCGDRLYLNSFAFYKLRGSRFCDIRAAVFRREWRRRGAA